MHERGGLIDALGLPPSASVNQRVPKKLLVENGAPTAADKRQINDGIEELQWVAALKPNTIGVEAYRDDEREAIEIAVLCLTLRAGAKAARLTELVHRAVPYLVVLVAEQGESLAVSLVDKRWSLGEAGKTVLDGEIVHAQLDEFDDGILGPFLASLPLTGQPRSTLRALYQSWMESVLALQAARITGSFALTASPADAAARRDGLKACAQLASRIASLRAAATKEKQLSRQVELNLELKRLQADYAAARATL